MSNNNEDSQTTHASRKLVAKKAAERTETVPDWKRRIYNKEREVYADQAEAARRGG